MYDWSTSPESAFSGSVQNILNSAQKHGNYTKGKRGVLEFLRGQEAFTLPFPARKKLVANYYNCFKVGQLYESDLISLLDIASDNDKFRYILVLVDCLSRRVFLRPLLAKTGKAVAAALEDIFSKDKQGRAPRYFRTDSGKEYLNSDVQRLFKQKNIQHRIGHHTHHAALAENAVRRTMKRLSRYFIFKHTHRWIDVLPQVETALNSVRMRSLNGMTPTEVFHKGRANRELGYDVWRRTVDTKARPFFSDQKRDVKRLQNKQRDIHIGDTVRVSIAFHPFRKAYAKNYSTQYYVVEKILKKQPVWLFLLKDLNGKLIEGSFHPDELQKVAAPTKQELYKIEKVLKSRFNKAKRCQEHLVRFEGYDKNFDMWIPDKDLVDI